MRIIPVQTKNGISNEKVYDVTDFPYEKCLEYELVSHTKSKKQVIEYYNVATAFDIEASTILPAKDSNGKFVSKPFGIMYQWQFCYDNIVCFGRTWEEFILLLDRLSNVLDLDPDSRRLVVYVHNLSYEFQFIKDFIKIHSMFAKDKRKPLKVVTMNGIEFRCSYFLSNMSLEKFCENTPNIMYPKAKGDLDYRIVRTPRTPLTELEEGYCYNDVRGLCECIAHKMETDNIAEIPMTSTSFVRREYRVEMRKNKKNRYIFEKTKLSVEQYKMLKRAFRGGDTHANRMYTGKIVENVHSYDISSSYPAQIACNYFPMGKFQPVTLDSQGKLDYYCNNYCVVMDIILYNVRVKENQPVPYIDIAHCWKKSKILNDNGRVLTAEYVAITVTEVDLKTIRECYNYDGFEILNAMYAKRGKLPKELIDTMLKFFEQKTKLKGIPDKVYEYMKSKNILNSTYGMMVSDLVHSEITYSQHKFEWLEEPADFEESLENFYKSKNNFLSYQWGVYVTAHARRQFREMVNKVGMDFVYGDTDSIKFVNEIHISEFEEKNKELIKRAEDNGAYCDRTEADGSVKRFYLGDWDYEGCYALFKTLGAKKYCFHKYNKKKKEWYFEVTVAGMSKKKGSERVGNIMNFYEGHKAFEDVGRTVAYYDEAIEEKGPHQVTINGDTFTTGSSIAIVDTTYTLGITKEYMKVIGDNFTNVYE